MIFISGILYLFALILGFFMEIPTHILIFLMLLFFISAFREKKLIYNGKNSKRNRYLSLLVIIILILILSIIQDKLSISSFTFISDGQIFDKSYLIFSYIVINFLINGITTLKEK